jgi:Lrp/AsnC family leucine-responsive transcriptional regulator
MNYIDIKDRKILHELDKNCRQSNAAIGKNVGLSKESVKYRIDKMVKSGIIVRFHTVINYAKLGYTKYKLYLRLKGADQRKIEEISNYCKNNKKTEWVVTCTGRWDMIVGFIVRTINEFDAEVQSLVNKFFKYIDEKALTTTLYLAHRLRKYLIDIQINEDSVYYTSMDKLVEIDNIDREIIKLLTNNGRLSIKDIAKRVGITPRITQYHIKRMEKDKIILAYKVHLDPQKIGKIFCKAMIYLRISMNKRLSQFIGYCSSFRETVWPQRVIGSWDFELDLEVEDYGKFQAIMNDLREKFSDMVQNYEFIIVSKEFKLDLFPECYSSI